MPLIQEVSGLGVAVPEMECNSMVEDRGIFNPGVHRSLIELVKAEDVGALTDETLDTKKPE